MTDQNNRPPYKQWWDDPLAQASQGSAYGQNPTIQRENTYPGDLHKVLLREREDGDFDAIDYFTRCGIGRYRFIPKRQPATLAMQIGAIALLVFVYSFVVWQIGRTYGQHEQLRADMRAEAP